MRPRPAAVLFGLALLTLALLGGCGKQVVPPAKQPGVPRVATLSPAATDLILGMGAGAQLVAVSNFDTPRDAAKNLPRVGDYETTDWEKLGELRPQVIVTQLPKGTPPPGFVQRAESLGIKLVNIHIDRLDDVLEAARQIGDAIGQPAKADALCRKLYGQFDAVRTRVASREKVKALMVLGADGQSVVGPETFLDELLTIAGGKNAAAGLNSPYPSVDAEKLMQLAPDVVLHLLPDESPQVQAQARQFWKKLPDLPAVKEGRVYFITDWFVLLPGAHTGEVADRFAQNLHPQAVP